MSERFAVRAPAKLNPVLRALGKRTDGYTELETGMVALELADRLEGEVDPRLAPGEVALALSGPALTSDVPADDRNLVVRAARAALARAAEVLGRPAPGVRLSLLKEIPSQAGLGGGSSDAAAALRLVEALCAVDLGSAWRVAALSELGSDTVFFEVAAGHGAGWCTGRGEVVAPLPAPAPEWWVALVTPEVPCPTGRVFAALDLAAAQKAAQEWPRAGELFRTCLAEGAEAARSLLHNPLELAALSAIPALRAWREGLDAAGAADFRMTGSGSSFFGLFEGAYDATAALEGVVREARRRSLALRGRWVTRTLAFDGEPQRARPSPRLDPRGP